MSAGGASVVDGHGVASVGMMDVVMVRAQNLEPWIRVAINKPLIKYLPMWMTANLITLIDFFVVVAFTVAAIMSQQVDSAVLSYALKVSVGLMFILFALLDVLDGDVARERNQCSPFGAAWDHFIDSMAVPMTVTASCIVTRTPSVLVISNIILIVLTYNMQATVHNDTGVWVEPQPGGCVAQMLSAVYIFVSAGISLLPEFGIATHEGTDQVLFYVACFASAALVPTCFAMIRQAGFGRAIEAGGCTLLALVIMAFTVDYGTYMDGALFAEGAHLTLVQYLMLSSAVSMRISGKMVIRTQDKQSFSGIDVRTVAWAVLLAFFRAMHHLGVQPFAAGSSMASLLALAEAWLPWIVMADLVVLSFVGLGSFYVRVMYSKRTD